MVFFFFFSLRGTCNMRQGDKSQSSVLTATSKAFVTFSKVLYFYLSVCLCICMYVRVRVCFFFLCSIYLSFCVCRCVYVRAFMFYLFLATLCDFVSLWYICIYLFVFIYLYVFIYSYLFICISWNFEAGLVKAAADFFLLSNCNMLFRTADSLFGKCVYDRHNAQFVSTFDKLYVTPEVNQRIFW